MELLLTLRNKKNIEKYINYCDGYIAGSLFTSGYNYAVKDIVEICNFCKANNMKFYITIDNFINEEDKVQLINYLDFIKKLDVDGIYFHDLGVYDIAKSLDMTSLLIYDGKTVMCNSLDVAFYMSKGINGVVIAHELTLQEVMTIMKNNEKKCDMLIFGHPRLSYSKRKFLTNYFKEIDMNYDYFNKDSMYLIEEQRDYKLPIIEDKSGTKIYADYVFQIYKELGILRQYIKRGIVDTLFIDEGNIIPVLRDYKRVTEDNGSFLLHNLSVQYPDNYSSGYLYQKTNITKDE